MVFFSDLSESYKYHRFSFIWMLGKYFFYGILCIPNRVYFLPVLSENWKSFTRSFIRLLKKTLIQLLSDPFPLYDRFVSRIDWMDQAVNWAYQVNQEGVEQLDSLVLLVLLPLLVPLPQGARQWPLHLLCALTYTGLDSLLLLSLLPLIIRILFIKKSMCYRNQSIQYPSITGSVG